jgi:hypothetical protein
VQSIFDRNLKLITALGYPLTLSLRNILHIVIDRVSIVFMLLVAIALGAADPFDVHQFFPIWQVVVYWPLALTIYIFLSLSMFFSLALLSGFFPNMRVFLPVKSALTMVPSVLIGEALAYLLTGGAHEIDVLGRIVLFFLLVQVFETVFYRFVVQQTAAYRAILAERGPEDAATPRHLPTEAENTDTSPHPEHRHILIGAEKVSVCDVHHIEAREHHVRVTLANASITHRARLSDIIAQTLPEDGFQTHRSWWVSKRAARSLERDGDRHVLTLHDNTRVPVARTRLAEVQNWIARHVETGFREI